jgi:glycosyltransferase A (GT-A) superfamily protein (DUF2064 family)
VNNKTAILFFSRTASSEADHKQWSKNNHLNHAVASLLIQNALNQLKKTHQSFYHFDEHLQCGNHFGEKLSNAFEALYEKGFSSVIAIGNDSLNWHNINWNELFESLQQGHSVLGPNYRGGAYLIGIHKRNFDKASFQKLPWQQPVLYQALNKHLGENATVLETAKERDFNTFHDLLLFIKAQRHQINLKSIQSVLRSILIVSTPSSNNKKGKQLLSGFKARYTLRPPPFFYA